LSPSTAVSLVVGQAEPVHKVARVHVVRVGLAPGYSFQDGMAFYHSTRDTATDFFIDYLPKGAHVFEYSVRVQLKGAYQSGLANIECMYAPEFNSHSASFALEVK
jgi:uncharacterized protein YfaS (alpha-2-macroglobulin family)